MSKRLEAAVKAWDHHWGDRYGDEALEEMGEEVQVALDAADEVMFSEKALDRVASVLQLKSYTAATAAIAFDDYRRVARAIISTLKAGADV